MATITKKVEALQRGVYKCSWEGLTDGDDGDWLDGSHLSDKTVQVFGTFGTGGTVVIEGSNDGGTTTFTLDDPQGNDLSLTAAEGKAIAENPELIRPRVTGGDASTDLDVHIVAEG